MIMFESGLHLDVKQARKVGRKACLVAILATVLPLVTGALLLWGFGYWTLKAGATVGVALAPTSVGIALRILGEARVLGQDLGQSIMTAALVDDILSLILFNILLRLDTVGNLDFEYTFFPAVLGIAFMIV